MSDIDALKKFRLLLNKRKKRVEGDKQIRTLRGETLTNCTPEVTARLRQPTSAFRHALLRIGHPRKNSPAAAHPRSAQQFEEERAADVGISCSEGRKDVEERLHTVVHYSVHLAHLLVLVLGGDGSLLAFKEGLAVLVELEGGDGAVGRVDGNVSLLSVQLFLDDFLNVDASTSAVHSGNLTLTALEGTSEDLDGVTLAHGDGAHGVLLLKVLGKVAGHHNATDAGGGGEVSLAGLSTLAGHAYL